jgi:hypothetical protein
MDIKGNRVRSFGLDYSGAGDVPVIQLVLFGKECGVIKGGEVSDGAVRLCLSKKLC